jgi:hypothetical protein
MIYIIISIIAFGLIVLLEYLGVLELMILIFIVTVIKVFGS